MLNKNLNVTMSRHEGNIHVGCNALLVENGDGE